MHVDESGRDDTVARVDRAASRQVAELPDGGDAIAPNCEVGANPGITGTIQEAPAPDHEIVGSLGSKGEPE